MDFSTMYLYVKPGCPFCARVDRFLEKAGIQIEHRSILEGNNREELVGLGGKAQVPCLIHDGQPLYESMDIVKFLHDAG